MNNTTVIGNNSQNVTSKGGGDVFAHIVTLGNNNTVTTGENVMSNIVTTGTTTQWAPQQQGLERHHLRDQ